MLMALARLALKTLVLAAVVKNARGQYLSILPTESSAWAAHFFSFFSGAASRFLASNTTATTQPHTSETTAPWVPSSDALPGRALTSADEQTGTTPSVNVQWDALAAQLDEVYATPMQVYEHIATLANRKRYVDIGARDTKRAGIVAKFARSSTFVEADPQNCKHFHALARQGTEANRVSVLCPTKFGAETVTGLTAERMSGVQAAELKRAELGLVEGDVYFTWLPGEAVLHFLKQLRKGVKADAIPASGKLVSWVHACMGRCRREKSTGLAVHYRVTRQSAKAFRERRSVSGAGGTATATSADPKWQESSANGPALSSVASRRTEKRIQATTRGWENLKKQKASGRPLAPPSLAQFSIIVLEFDLSEPWELLDMERVRGCEEKVDNVFGVCDNVSHTMNLEKPLGYAHPPWW
ncbi:unnamed protein product [Amoebophrya sp. A120]|nr:unnamed protein product [Amoebophrya sp. A120]|eukprot:GSA120T00020637001.1